MLIAASGIAASRGVKTVEKEVVVCIVSNGRQKFDFFVYDAAKDLAGCQDEQSRELRRGGAADGRDGHRSGIRGRDTCVIDQTTEGGEKGGHRNFSGGLSLQLPGEVRNVFLILALADNYFLVYSVLMAWVLSNVRC